MKKETLLEAFVRVPTAFAFGLAVGVLVFSMQAWAQSGFPAPPDPPNNNAAAPLNVGLTPQTKLGGLTIEQGSILIRNLLGGTSGLIVENGNVGIGTLTPVAKLDVNGSVIIRGGSPGPNKVLTSLDDNGTATWENSPGVTVSALDYFEIDIPRAGEVPRASTPVGIGTLSTSPGLVTNTYTTSVPYTFCAIARVDAEMGRVDAGSISGSECRVIKNGDGSWTLQGTRRNDPAFWCSMYCFK